MPRSLTSLLVFALCTSFVSADDKPAAPPDPATKALQSLVQEFNVAQNKFVERVKAAEETAKKSGSPAKPTRFEDGPALEFSPRFLALAEKYPKGATGFQAVCIALQTSGGPTSTSGIWSKGMTLLKNRYAVTPEIKPLLGALGSANDESATSLIHEVIAKNPDRKLQALACRSLASGLEGIAEMVEKIKRDPELHRNFDSIRGKPYVDKLLADQDKNVKEAAALRKQIREKYADVIADVSIGNPAPEIVIEDVDGNKAKLSDLKGKVVVLDIWATWCAPCKAMIPHEREMVARLKDKPFALISISADEKKQTLKEFLSKEKMPWTHWWNGSQGGVIDDWNVQYFPTIYVIDSQGVIRHKDLREQKLEAAVDELLKGMVAKKAG